MISFKRKVALEIAAVSVILASVASPLAWYVSREKAEESIVSFAMEESHRVLEHHEAILLDGPDAKAHAEAAARTLSGGLFEIAEVYGANGNKLAEGLTREGETIEKEIMRTHVAMGEEIVMGAGWLDGGREVVASHHEKWDGTGYPHGQVGEAIPLVARIFAIVDVFDALCSRRPYKEPIALAAVMEILQQGSGTHFDPNLLKTFSGLASDLYRTTVDTSEFAVRSLMEGMVRKHFGL